MGVKGLNASIPYLIHIPGESSVQHSERKLLFDEEIHKLIQEVIAENPDKTASQLASIVINVARERNLDTGMTQLGLTGKIRPLLKKKP